MGNAILITGFNNWGKSTLIRSLFNRHRFDFGTLHRIQNVNTDFVVEPMSNDDLSENNFLARLTQRMTQAPGNDNNLLCAFCPTRERNNDSLRILSDNVFSHFDEIYLFLLQYKWDYHAELIVTEIQSYYNTANIDFRVINADQPNQDDQQRLIVKTQQVVDELRKIF